MTSASSNSQRVEMLKIFPLRIVYLMRRCLDVGVIRKPVLKARSRIITAAATEELTTPQTAALISGALFNPVVLYSEWTLYSTGKGLDPGPAGIYGALEGVGKSLWLQD